MFLQAVPLLVPHPRQDHVVAQFHHQLPHLVLILRLSFQPEIKNQSIKERTFYCPQIIFAHIFLTLDVLEFVEKCRMVICLEFLATYIGQLPLSNMM